MENIDWEWDSYTDDDGDDFIVGTDKYGNKYHAIGRYFNTDEHNDPFVYEKSIRLIKKGPIQKTYEVINDAIDGHILKQMVTLVLLSLLRLFPR